MILLLSGGLDSLAIWRLLGCRAVTFDLDTTALTRESEAILWMADKTGLTFEKRSMGMGEYEAANSYVPYRNPLLILAAAQLDPHVVIGQIAEWAPDKNPRFYRRLERTVNVEGKHAQFTGGLKVDYPYARIAKGRLMKLYAQTFGEDEVRELLRRAWSCYRSGDVHCGECGGCGQRFNAEVFFARLCGQASSYYLSNFAVMPSAHSTPMVDRLRWLRDGGPVAVQQILERRKQDAAGNELRELWGRASGPVAQ